MKSSLEKTHNQTDSMLTREAKQCACDQHSKHRSERPLLCHVCFRMAQVTILQFHAKKINKISYLRTVRFTCSGKKLSEINKRGNENQIFNCPSREVWIEPIIHNQELCVEQSRCRFPSNVNSGLSNGSLVGNSPLEFWKSFRL